VKKDEKAARLAVKAKLTELSEELRLIAFGLATSIKSAPDRKFVSNILGSVHQWLREHRDRA
jgi:hypothetical protein